MADDVKSSDLNVLRRWGPLAFVALSGVVWGVRLEARVDATGLAQSNGLTDMKNLEAEVNTLRTDIIKFQGTTDTLKVMIESLVKGVDRIEKKLDEIQKKRTGD